MDLTSIERSVQNAQKLSRLMLQDPIGMVEERYFDELAKLLILKLEDREIEEILHWYHSDIGKKVRKIGEDFIKEILSGKS